ncbi:MAG: YqjD family protein [Geminicoccaceae bacterium]
MSTKDTSNSANDVQQDIAALRADLANLVNSLQTEGRQQVGSVVDRLSEETRDALERGRASVDHGQILAQRSAGEAQDWIRAHPLTAILCAAGIGYVLAQFHNRR